MYTRTQEKGAVTPQETDPDVPVIVQESGGGVGLKLPAAGSGALSVVVHAWDLLKQVAIIFIISIMVWSQIKQQGGNTAPPFIENWIKDLLSMAPPIRTRPSFPLKSVSLIRMLP